MLKQLLVAAAASATLVVAACADSPTAPSGAAVVTGPAIDLQQDAINDDAFYLNYLETGRAGAVSYNREAEQEERAETPPRRCTGANTAPGAGRYPTPGTNVQSDCSERGGTTVTGQTRARVNCENKGQCWAWIQGGCRNTCGQPDDD